MGILVCKRFIQMTAIFCLISTASAVYADSTRSAISDSQPSPNILSCDGLLRQVGLLVSKIGIWTNFFYTTNRGLGEYSSKLGKNFDIALMELKDGDHWVDVGSGQAVAQLRYQTIEKYPSKAKTTSISVLAPPSYYARRLISIFKSPNSWGRHNYIQGRFLEEIPTSEIDQASLVTDLLGALAYAPHLDEALMQEALLLGPGGKLITFFFYDGFLEIKDQNGNTVSPKEYLASVKGLESLPILDGRRDKQGNESNTSGPKMIRTNEPLNVPKLDLVSFIPGNPPMRKYVWKRQKTN